MNENLHFDVVIIGGGQAGPPLAHQLAKAGKRVALAERKHLGGSCVNFGCTPTKAAIASARVAHLARRGAEFGLKIPEVTVDFASVLKRAREIARESRQGLEGRFKDTDNPKLFCDHARLEGRGDESFRVRVGDTLLTAKEIVLNTGTRSLIPPIEGLEASDFIDAENWLYKDELPEHLLIIGGSYIGLEMGQFYRRMGSRVTVVEAGGQIAPREDEDVAAALYDLLGAEGIGFKLKTRVRRIAKDDTLTVTLEGEDGSQDVIATHLLVAVGRKPNTDDLGLETVGVAVNEKGIVIADERLKTSVEGIWVAGDIRGGPMFTHTSWDDHRVLASQLLGDGSRTTERVVPYAMFTDPELGRVGMTETAAREAGKNVKIAKFEMKQNGKAREVGEPKGFIKVVVDAETDQILGAAVLAAEGAELVHVYIDLMNARAPYTIIEDAVHIHPTLAEALQSALKGLK